MLFVTAFLLGLAAGTRPSLGRLAVVAVLFSAAFLVASLSAGGMAFGSLCIAWLGLNAGIMSPVIGSVLLECRRRIAG